ncbi:putative transcriptional regulator [Gordonia hirsuta DSM 44140 = NBRC 16056]|uniref:Putative transcriptional regulator n=1 Tax=Gordonia hirsuta DSM 44140 = NBRC 16056 TaxID=1121927 RepID=L7LA35_9ACTN|nr:hypothetical protein [Gordonia hirsuta]GAC56917.1 putative transcriptional regulator [Gordonia hirsuta DSM 44140 = NBRC 16056]
MTAPLILREEPFTEPTVVDLPEGIVTVTEFAEAVSAAELPAIFDAGFPALAAFGPIGPGYALYSGRPSGWFDLEIGFPITAASAAQAHAAGAIPSTFPSGPALVLSHLGPYDGLDHTRERLLHEFTERELGPPRLLAEIFLADPSASAPADLRADLLVAY